MSVARRFAAALSVIGLGVLAYAVPAAAIGDEDRPAAGGCVDGTVPGNVEAVLDARSGTAVARGRDGAAVCAGTEVDLVLSAYELPADWDGTAFPGTDAGRAWPQHSRAHSTAKLSGAAPLELTVPVPGCGNVQVSLYTGAPVDEIGETGWAGHTLLAGWMWSVEGPAYCGPGDGSGPVPLEPTTAATTTAPTSGSPTPTPTTTAPSTTAATTTAPATTAASTTAASTTAPSPTESTTAAVAPGTTTPAPAASASRVISSPVPVPPTTPELAKTGSDATVPMIAIGAGLLLAGIVLSLVGRRRRTT